jgi:hypothetical protein
MRVRCSAGVALANRVQCPIPVQFQDLQARIGLPEGKLGLWIPDRLLNAFSAPYSPIQKVAGTRVA